MTQLSITAIERVRSDPARYVPMFEEDPISFLVEQARIDSPVTGVSAVAPAGGHTLRLRSGGTLTVPEGSVMQLLISHANRDARVFDDPYAFNPKRKNLDQARPRPPPSHT